MPGFGSKRTGAAARGLMHGLMGGVLGALIRGVVRW